MLEPLSTLTFVGFAIGALGFLVNSVSRIDERLDEMRECKSRLRSFELELRAGYLRLRAWHLLWFGKKAFAEDTYISFWGIQGFEEIQMTIKQIEELSVQIRGLLKAPSTLHETETHEWNQFFRDDSFESPALSTLDERKHRILSKIRFTLFENTALQEKVGRFKSHISDLETASRLFLRLNQNKDLNAEITSEEILNMSKVEAFISNLSMFACSLYEHQSKERKIRWALELSPPEDEQTLDPLQIVEATHLDFFVRNALQSPVRAERFRVYLPEELVQIQQRPVLVFDEIYRLITNQRCSLETQSETLLDLLKEPRSQSRSFRKMLTSGIFYGARGKSFDIERAELAYGLAYWLILLWNTPWSLGLCSCGIRGTYLLQSGTRHAFKTRMNRVHWDPPCYQDERMVDHRLLLLGTTLAEIALMETLSISYDKSEIVQFKLQEQLIEKTKLIHTLRKKCGRDNITKAVRYCLDFDNEPGKDLRPENIEDFRQNILLP